MPDPAGNAASSTAPDREVRGFSFALEKTGDGLQLRALHHPQYGALRVDWTAQELNRRIAGGRRQLLARALGLHRTRDSLRVLDATAGLGRDGYTLAALGLDVTLCERQPLLLALLRDAHHRALQNETSAAIAQRIVIVGDDAATAMAGSRYDAIYLDPMYPHDGKSALPQKEMQLLRELTGGDSDADALLAPALACARRRVVVKRPLRAPRLAQREPAYSLEGTQARFDVYLVSAGS